MVSGMNTIQTLPLDMITVLLESALEHGFQCFHNFLKAWAQSQRAPVIRTLLDGLSIRRLYKFGNCSSSEDISSFEDFMQVACDIGVVDAIVFRSCRGLFSNLGNANAHFAALEELSGKAHLLAQVALFITKILYCRHNIVSALDALLRLHGNKWYRQNIVSAMESVEVIYRLAEPLGITHSIVRPMCCPLHATGETGMFISNFLELEVCLFCDMACIISNFTSRVTAG